MQYLRSKVKTLFKNIISNEDGLSLIEAAIGLIVIGLVTVPLMQAYQIDLMKEADNDSRGGMSLARDAINQYYLKNQAYPCPASLVEPPDTNLYGKSFAPCNLANIPNCVANDLPASGEGVCKTGNTIEDVVIGAIPFASIHLFEEASLDYWNNRLTYAVTIKQTDPTTFSSAAGQIRVKVVDDPSSPTADSIPDFMADRYEYIIVAAGPDQRGAFSRNGIRSIECGGAAEGYDHENCDFDDTFFLDKDPEFISANSRSNATSVDDGGDTVYYDDYTLAQLSMPTGRWFQHEDNMSYTNKYAITQATRIGVGFNNPTQTLDVNGNIMIQNQTGSGQGRLKTAEVCEDGTMNCMPITVLTDNTPSMKCDNSDAYYGDQPTFKISDNSVKCAAAGADPSDPTDPAPPMLDKVLKINTSGKTFNLCGSGKIANGITSSGAISCVDYY